MIQGIEKCYVSGVPDSSDSFGLLFWTYLICLNSESRFGDSYDLIRISNTLDQMEVLRREICLAYCKKLIREHDSEYEE